MLQLKRALGPKGQLVLPKDIRQYFNLQTGSEVIFYIENDKIVVQPAINSARYVENFCAIGKNMKKLTMKEIKQLQEEQYAKR